MYVFDSPGFLIAVLLVFSQDNQAACRCNIGIAGYLHQQCRSLQVQIGSYALESFKEIGLELVFFPDFNA